MPAIFDGMINFVVVIIIIIISPRKQLTKLIFKKKPSCKTTPDKLYINQALWWHYCSHMQFSQKKVRSASGSCSKAEFKFWISLVLPQLQEHNKTSLNA